MKTQTGPGDDPGPVFSLKSGAFAAVASAKAALSPGASAEAVLPAGTSAEAALSSRASAEAAHAASHHLIGHLCYGLAIYYNCSTIQLTCSIVVKR